MGAENQPAKDDKIQSQGRKDNAAQHLNDAPDNRGAERYPSVNKDDSVDLSAETRSFEGGVESAEPRRDGQPDPELNQSQGQNQSQGGSDSADVAAEGKR